MQGLGGEPLAIGDPILTEMLQGFAGDRPPLQASRNLREAREKGSGLGW